MTEQAGTARLAADQIAAGVCYEILAEHPDQPLAVRMSDHIWPRVHEATPACPLIPGDAGEPAGPCLILVPSGHAVFVNVWTGAEWVKDVPDRKIPYPEGFTMYRTYPAGTEFGEQFRQDLTALITRNLQITHEGA